MAKSKITKVYESKVDPNTPLEGIGIIVSKAQPDIQKTAKPRSIAKPAYDYLTLINKISIAHDTALGLKRVVKANMQGEKIGELLDMLVGLCNRNNYSEISGYLQRRITAMEQGHVYASSDSRVIISYRKKKPMSPTKLKRKYQNALDKLNSSTGAKIYTVKWNKVSFENGALRVATPEGYFSCICRQSRQSYNLFIEAIVERIPPLRVIIYQFKPAEIIHGGDLNEIFQLLAIKDAVRQNNTDVLLRLPSILEGLPNKYQHLFLPEGRNEYIKYLVERQVKDYRFVPVFEQSTGAEESFLFTIFTNKLVIIWENLSPNTATFVFSCTDITHKEVQQRIYDYACSDIAYKRLRLHPNSLDPIIGLKYTILYHTDFQEWEAKLNQI